MDVQREAAAANSLPGCQKTSVLLTAARGGVRVRHAGTFCWLLACFTPDLQVKAALLPSDLHSASTGGTELLLPPGQRWGRGFTWGRGLTLLAEYFINQQLISS